MLTRIIKLAAIATLFLALQSCQDTGGPDVEFETLHILREADTLDSTEIDTLEEMMASEQGAVQQDSI